MKSSLSPMIMSQVHIMRAEQLNYFDLILSRSQMHSCSLIVVLRI